ncbi:MAG: SMI1/KNR4 family protein [Emticicia sp.]|nr:SMI1/KNR4 family protein [Emticicia sp.]
MNENIIKLEEEIGAILPSEYKDFLLNTDKLNTSDFKIFDVKIDNEILEFCITDFETFPNLLCECKSLLELSLKNIESNGIYITNEDCFLFIAHEIGGRSILIGIKEPFYGMIYLLDNDSETNEIAKHFVSNSFTEFYNSLRLEN